MLLILLFLFFSAVDADEILQQAFQTLEANVKRNKEISLHSDDLRLGENERLLLSAYDNFPLKPFPVLVTTAVLEDGFGDYIQLKNILELLRDLKFTDVEVLIYFSPNHTSKIASNPLPKDFNYHFVEYNRQNDPCTLKEEKSNLAVSKKEFCQAIANHSLFKAYREGKRDLIVVAAFFSEAFGKLKANGRRPLFLREITPYLKNAILQDLFVLGWGANQAMFVDKKFLLIKSLALEEKTLLALKIFPERLLKKMCGSAISEESLLKYFEEHTRHHAYFHQKESNLAFLKIILHGLETHLRKHDFFLKNLPQTYQMISSDRSIFEKIHSIEFHFLDGSIKTIQGEGDRVIRLIETEFLSSAAYALLISLISPPFIEGCTGDNSPQQALLFEHVPLIEHTESKDFAKKDEVERHYFQNSISLFQSLAQLNPYPDALSKLFYLTDLLMFTIRQNPQDKEIPILTEMIGLQLKSQNYRSELNEFTRFITKERNLKPIFKQMMIRQGMLAKHPIDLRQLEKKFLTKLHNSSSQEANAILMDLTSELSRR